MDYKPNNRCKICTSDLKDKIDSFLEQGKSYRIIAEWVNKYRPDANISKPNISRHNTVHRLEGKKGTLKRGAVKKTDKKKNEKITDKPIDNIKTNIVEDNEKNSVELDMDKTSDFLNTIINKVKERLENNEIKPTITEGIKATELKIKIDKGSPFESTLLNFLETVSEK